MLEVKNLSFAFPTHAAVNDLNLHHNQHSVIAFLGHNGAGKTTTLRLLAGHLQPASGEVKVLSEHPLTHPEVRSKIGFLPENPALYPEYRVREQLRFSADLYQLPTTTYQQNLERVIELCALEDFLHKFPGQLSKGLQQRVSLAQSLIHNPQLILLDEPGSNLDPLERHRLSETLKKLGQDACVIYSTHHLGDALSVADFFWVIATGQQRFYGSREQLSGSEMQVEVRFKNEFPESQLTQTPDIEVIRKINSNTFVLKAKPDPLPILVRAGYQISTLRASDYSAEDQLLRWLGDHPQAHLESST